MASIQSVIEIIFNATNNASDEIGRLGDDLGKLDANVQGIAAPFADLANGLLKAEAAALAFGAAVAVLAVRETVQFQDSLYLVNKQLGDSGVSMDEARVKIEALGLQYGINANEVAKSAAGFLAAGHDYETSAKLVETSTQLMIAGELDAAFAVDAINKSLAGFRIPADEAATAATKIGDILNKIGDISSGNFEEIVQGFIRISPTAKDAGLSMEETAASIAVLVDVFGSGEIAATALKSGLLSLLNPSNEAAETLTALGIAATNQNGELRSSKDLITDLAGKWGTLTDAQKQQTAAIIFGKDQAGAMSALLGDWGKQQEYVTQLVDKTTGAVGSMAREVEGKLKLISASLATANESWRQFLENLGAKITDGDQLNGLIGNLGAVGIAFKDVVNQGGFDPLIDLLKSQAGSLSTLFESIAANLQEAFKGLDWSGLTDSLGDLGESVGDLFQSFFGDIDLTTVEGLTSALQTVMNTFESLTRVVSGIASEFRPFADMLGETTRHFNDLDDASKLEFGQTLGGMKLLVDAGTGLGLALIAIGRAGLDMGTVLDAVFGGTKVAVNALQLGFETLALGVVKTSQVALEAGLALYKLNPFGDDSKIADAEAKIKALQGTADVIFESMERNSQELRDGWNQATGDATEKTEALRKGLDKGEAALRATGAAAKDAGDDLEQFGRDVNDALNQVESSIKVLDKIDLTDKFKIDKDALDFKFSPEDFDIGNPFEEAQSGVDAFQKAADNLDFGTDKFEFGEKFTSEVDKVSAALEKAITGGNAGGYEVKFNWDGSAELIANASTLKSGFEALDGTVRTTADGFKYIETAGKDGVRSFQQLGPAFGGVKEEMTALEKAQQSLDDAFGKSGASVGAITGAFNEYMGALGQSGKLTVDQFVNLTKVVNDYKVAMEEIASNERIKTIEFAVELQTAKLETDMERVKATFASIDTTIQSTGDLLGSLFGNFTETGDRYKQLEIQEQIDLENKRRQEALDLQKKLAEAEIERIEAQTASLSRGDPLITIQGDGLEPELEAFMWKILSKIRVRANAEFADYLLGLGVTA